MTGTWGDEFYGKNHDIPAKNAAQHVLSRLLQPVTNGIFKLLVLLHHPRHRIVWYPNYLEFSIASLADFHPCDVFLTHCQLDGSCHRQHRSLGFSSSDRQPEDKNDFLLGLFGRDLHNGIWLEVYVSVKRKQERVVCPLPLLLLRFQAGVTYQIKIKIKIKIKNVLWLLLIRL